MEMDKLLQKDYIAYLNSLRPHVVQCVNVSIGNIKSDVIDDIYFDIQDKKDTIKQPLGTGSVTYENLDRKIITVIDYENFLDQQPSQPKAEIDVIKALKLKKCDFILYHLDGNDFFILNELSQSGLSTNKLNEARKQLHNAIFHFLEVPVIESFINGFTEKLCIFSNKPKKIKTPDDIAAAFDLITDYLPQPIKHNYGPIKSLKFELIETAIVNV